jgi:hypothetical protein
VSQLIDIVKRLSLELYEGLVLIEALGIRTNGLVCTGIVTDQDGGNDLVMSVAVLVFVVYDVLAPPCCTATSASQVEDCV